jgi:hypothetical protein
MKAEHYWTKKAEEVYAEIHYRNYTTGRKHTNFKVLNKLNIDKLKSDSPV